MPLILESSKDNKLEFQYDGGGATLFYADPSTKQRISYSNQLVQRKGNKIRNGLAATGLKGGKAVCTGMGEGDFAIPAENEKGYVLISSDPASKDYRKDWKILLETHQADYLMLLGMHVFEGTAATADPEDEDDDDVLEPDSGEPEQGTKQMEIAEDPFTESELGK